MMAERRKGRRVELWFIVVQGVTTAMTIGALVWVLTTASTERTAARRDSCRLLKGVVLVSTPPMRKAQVQAFIAKTKLADCEKYADNP